jgi:hypothetical protein
MRCYVMRVCLFAWLLVLCLALGGCGNAGVDPVGEWESTEIDWPMKMFLRDDGRASVSTMQIDQTGSWKQQGNRISMTLKQVDGFGPTQLEAKLRGNQITVEYLEHDYSLQKVQAGDR